jgi:hypothetical protein
LNATIVRSAGSSSAAAGGEATVGEAGVGGILAPLSQPTSTNSTATAQKIAYFQGFISGLLIRGWQEDWVLL